MISYCLCHCDENPQSNFKLSVLIYLLVTFSHSEVHFFISVGFSSGYLWHESECDADVLKKLRLSGIPLVQTCSSLWGTWGPQGPLDRQNRQGRDDRNGRYGSNGSYGRQERQRWQAGHILLPASKAVRTAGADPAPDIGHLPGDRDNQESLPQLGTGRPAALGTSSKTPDTRPLSETWQPAFFPDLVSIIIEQCQIINFPLNINYL